MADLSLTVLTRSDSPKACRCGKRATSRVVLSVEGMADRCTHWCYGCQSRIDLDELLAHLNTVPVRFRVVA